MLNKNVNFNKNETELKMENPTHCFREANLVSAHIRITSLKFKVKLWWVGAREKKGHFLDSLFCPKEIF